MGENESLSLPSLQRVLALDPTLREDERKALASLLLSGGWVKFSDLATMAGLTRGTVYEVVRRMEGRDLVVTDQGPGLAKKVRTVDPRLLLPALTAHADVARRKADELSREFADIRGRLVEIYDKPGEGGPIGPSDLIHYTRSVNSSIGRLLRLVKEATSDVWVLGNEAPWVFPSSLLLSEMMSRAMPPGPLKVRFLVTVPEGDSNRSGVLSGLEHSSVQVKFTEAPFGPYVVVDGSTLFLYQPPAGPSPSGYYVDVVAPGLCADILRSAEKEWRRLEAKARLTKK